MPSEEELQQGFRLGDWEILPGRGVLRRGDAEERPEPLVLKVLLALAMRNGELVTRDQLIDEIWDGRPIGDEPINRCLSQLRGHLGDKQRPHQYIETLTKRGYRLAVPVELASAPVVAAARDDARRLRNRGRLWMFVAAVVITLAIGTVLRIAPPIADIESIGVLPFQNLSGDASDQYRVSGFKVELVHTLDTIPSLAVKHGRVMYPNREVGDIADILDVDYVLSGELQHIDDVLKVTYRLERGADGETVSSGEVTGRIGEEFRMQGELAKQVRDDLIGESPQQLISDQRNPESAAFDRYMQGLHLFERRGRGRVENLDSAVALFEESIEFDPNFGPAYLSLATAYALLPDYRQAPLQESHNRALQLAEQAVAVDSNLYGASRAIVGYVHHKRRQWVAAEDAYRQATTADIVDSNAFNWYSLMLGRVGRLEDSLEQILIAKKMDPTSAVINSRVGIAYNWLGQSKMASEYFAAAERYDASDEINYLGRALLQIRERNFVGAAEFTRAAVTESGGSTAWVGPFYAALEDSERAPDVRQLLDDAFRDPNLDQRLNVVARTLLDDVDGAMDVAMQLAEEEQIAEVDLLFMPELHPLREHPRFTELMDRLGVLEYWDAKQCVWRDDRINCPASR